ncbi:MAG TPA: trypsin-like peptidase domain-containing protein, partial [Patescibacteria group bacterium]|nr:trypsin-like peptidase domain-containing protein [Patescibacteria group bacterium]
GAAPGSAISVFSYPSTATFNDRDFLTPSFTQGVISAVKDSGNGFKIFQTDAKISTGSSGGPLLNAAGQVVGIITFETGDAGSGQGDNFAFALPVELIKQMMDASGVSNDTNNFYDAFARGLLLQNGRHCRQAIAEFQQAGTANAAFIAPAKLDSRIGDCQASIDAGLSLDTPWDAFRNWLAMVPVWLWLLAAGGLLLLLILAVIIFRQSRWLQKEDLEIKQLEREVESSRSEAAGGFTMPVPRPSEAGLREYVAAARARGLAEPIIAAELRQAGFSEQKISEELSVK